MRKYSAKFGVLAGAAICVISATAFGGFVVSQTFDTSSTIIPATTAGTLDPNLWTVQSATSTLSTNPASVNPQWSNTAHAGGSPGELFFPQSYNIYNNDRTGGEQSYGLSPSFPGGAVNPTTTDLHAAGQFYYGPPNTSGTTNSPVYGDPNANGSSYALPSWRIGFWDSTTVAPNTSRFASSIAFGLNTNGSLPTAANPATVSTGAAYFQAYAYNQAHNSAQSSLAGIGAAQVQYSIVPAGDYFADNQTVSDGIYYFTEDWTAATDTLSVHINSDNGYQNETVTFAVAANAVPTSINSFGITMPSYNGATTEQTDFALDSVKYGTSPVPEPASIGLILAGSALLCGRRHRA